MKFLQKLGKALMLPVAILPICGILMGIGYRLCPATMQGGDIQGAVDLIGLFLVKAGGALIDNMAILFAIGVGVGMSEKNDGTGGIAALASWLMMKTLLATGFVTTIMVKCAKPGKKKVAIGLVASAALCAFICGVTEPFEFGFMFLAPVLYVIYAALYGIFTMITVALGFRAGFSFSAGAMDLFFSASLPAAAKIWLIIPLGIAAFLVFYFVFLFAIKKFDLKTPGREDDDDLEAEKNVELASDDFTAIAAKILEGCGGKENIASIDNCVTRLRLEVKDMTAVNDKVIKSAGVAGVIRPGKTSVQVIVGTKVQFVADAFSKLCE